MRDPNRFTEVLMAILETLGKSGFRIRALETTRREKGIITDEELPKDRQELKEPDVAAREVDEPMYIYDESQDDLLKRLEEILRRAREHE